jgi:hypothetical protein
MAASATGNTRLLLSDLTLDLSLHADMYHDERLIAATTHCCVLM